MQTCLNLLTKYMHGFVCVHVFTEIETFCMRSYNDFLLECRNRSQELTQC